MNIGNRIKELRKAKKLNQTELGEKIGLSYGGVAAIEQGRSDPSTETIIKLSEIFEVSADYLLTGNEVTNEISQEERDILSVLREDKAMRNAMMEVARIKKKAISYLASYKQAEQHAAI